MALYRRGQLITSLARWFSVGLALLALVFIWDSPDTRRGPALAVGLGYGAFNLVSQVWLRRRWRGARILHDLVDALAVGLGAAASGGLSSPVWLLLYPQVVAVAVRGGLAYAMLFGVVDSLIVGLLASLSAQPLGNLHAVALLFCAFMGGTTSSYLKTIQRRLAHLNQELTDTNRRLEETVAAQGVAQREQEKRREEFESLLPISRGVLERLELSQVLPLVTRGVNRVMGTQHCLLLLRRADRLEVAAQEGFEPEVVQAMSHMRVGESLSGWVAHSGVTLALEDLREDRRARFIDVADRFGYVSFLCVPLKRAGEVLGTLEVVTKQRRRFDADEQRLMAAFADQAAVAIENARLFAEARAHLAQVVDANRRLEELDRLRREYLRNVSHEFRTPLTVIRGYAEFLLEEPAADLGPIMPAVLDSCDRLIDLVDTLIDVSRIEQEDAEQLLKVQPVDLAELAGSSVEALQPAAARRGVRLELELPDERLGLMGDHGLLQQVLKKLVDNAVKYSDAGKRVVVRGRANGADSLLLEVEDAGPGIAPEHLPRIFEKFYTVDGSLTRRVGGTGVGLYLVREIVRLHKGQISVESRCGAGSVFTVRLPRQGWGDPERRAPA